MNPRKIFILSLHRTATQSTHQLLIDSGINAIHWPSRVEGTNYQSQAAGIEDDPQAIIKLLNPVTEKYDAMSDVPYPVLFKELHSIYPDAVFAALYRQPYDWVNSVRRHIGERELDPYEKVQYWKYLTDKPLHIHTVPDDRLIKMHIKHYAELLNYFADNPAFRLFHMNDANAGEKLCDFLGLPPVKLGRVDKASMWDPVNKKTIKPCK